MKRLCTLMLAVMLLLPMGILEAAPTWDEVGNHIKTDLDGIVAIYEAQGSKPGYDAVNDIYYAIYEKDGMEAAVRTTISAKSANLTEYQFYKLKKAMLENKPASEVAAEVATLKKMIDIEVQELQHSGGPTGGWASFWPAFLILLREGVEAILVLVAIIAYLRRGGQERALNTVYNYAIGAVVASFGAAYLFSSMTAQATAGHGRELIEGLTALFAVAVLLGTSAWMGSKASAQSWNEYIKNMVNTSLSEGKTRALGMAAFLAVFREGAEVILFYQALFNNAAGDIDMIWLGFAAGCLVLAVLFFLIQTGSLMIPIGPFFRITSVLMFLLAVTFLGGGINELQEASLLPITVIEAFPAPSIDLLGLYPTYETLLPQIMLLIGGAVAFHTKSQAA